MFQTLFDEISSGADNAAYVYVGDLKRFAIQCKFTGTVTGTIKVSGTCDNPALSNGLPSSPSSLTWDDFEGMSLTLSGETSTLFDFPEGTGAGWVKVTWAKSGTPTGTISAKIHGK